MYKRQVLDKQGEYIARIHALESRPVEVAVQEPDPAEVERMAEEKARAMTAGLRGQLKTAEAVSYTHLDVYKRQEHRWTRPP